MKYFICAGEASGDFHASLLIAALKEKDHEAQFRFLGGRLSINQIGHEPIIDIKEMSVMGFGEVIRKLPSILGHLKKAKKCLSEWRPDAVILIDYPSFNLKLAKHAHSLGLKVYWYISPKVWVWKEHRVKPLKKYVDKLFCILPFEVEYFKQRHDWNVEYVGNPSVEEVTQFKQQHNVKPSIEIADILGGPTDKPILALLPGSRFKEVKSNLPIMVEAAAAIPGYTAVVSGVSQLPNSLYEELAPGLPVITDNAFGLLECSQAALVTSGTATLETALFKVPQVMLYRHSGSKIAYKLFRRLLKVRYFSLPNLITDNETICELVMHFCTPEAVKEKLVEILPGGNKYAEQQSNYGKMTELLGTASPSVTVANLIFKDISKN